MRNSALCAAVAICAGVALLALPVRAAEHDKWLEVRSPNFIVVSNGSEGDARKVALQFEQIRQLFRDSLAYTRDHPSPVITILAAKDEKTLSELLPEYWEKGHSHPAGIFLDAYDQFQIAINLESHGDNSYEAIYHEYYHSVTVPYFSGLPLWLTEGLADFYGNSEINDKNAAIGMANIGLIAELRSKPLLPLSTLFSVSYDSPYYNEQNKVSIFYAESWALTHYLMIGDNRSHRPEFNNFLAAMDKGQTTQQAAATAFGDLGKMQSDLERYVHSMAFLSLIVPAPERMDPKGLRARTLSDAEADAYRGGFLVLHKQYKDAQALLDESARLDPKLALAQENRGLLQYAQQQSNDALASFSAAIAIDPDNAYTRYMRAQLGYTAGQTAGATNVDDDLRHAIASNPNFAPPYGLLALRVAGSNAGLPEAVSLIQKAEALEPGRWNYQFILAQLLIRMERFDDAETSARSLQIHATEPAQRQEVSDLLDAVKQGREFAAQRAQRQRETAAAGAAARDAGARGDSNAAVQMDEASVRPESTEPVAIPPKDNRIRGLAAEVVCNGNAMKVTVKTDDSTVVLHVANASKVDYTSYVLIRAGSISPCDDLKGRTVRVTTKDGTPAGEITALDIMK